MPRPSPYDLDEWEERLRLQGHWGRRGICRAIEDTPGNTLGEKRAYWESEPPLSASGWWKRLKEHTLRAGVRNVLEEMIREHGRDATSRHPPNKPFDPLDQAQEQGQQTAAAQEAKDAKRSILEQGMAKALKAKEAQGFGPDTEEYKRTFTSWSRLLEDEMKR